MRQKSLPFSGTLDEVVEALKLQRVALLRSNRLRKTIKLAIYFGAVLWALKYASSFEFAGMVMVWIFIWLVLPFILYFSGSSVYRKSTLPLEQFLEAVREDVGANAPVDLRLALGNTFRQTLLEPAGEVAPTEGRRKRTLKAFQDDWCHGEIKAPGGIAIVWEHAIGGIRADGSNLAGTKSRIKFKLRRVHRVTVRFPSSDYRLRAHPVPSLQAVTSMSMDGNSICVKAEQLVREAPPDSFLEGSEIVPFEKGSLKDKIANDPADSGVWMHLAELAFRQVKPLQKGTT